MSPSERAGSRSSPASGPSGAQRRGAASREAEAVGRRRRPGPNPNVIVSLRSGRPSASPVSTGGAVELLVGRADRLARGHLRGGVGPGAQQVAQLARGVEREVERAEDEPILRRRRDAGLVRAVERDDARCRRRRRAPGRARSRRRRARGRTAPRRPRRRAAPPRERVAGHGLSRSPCAATVESGSASASIGWAKRAAVGRASARRTARSRAASRACTGRGPSGRRRSARRSSCASAALLARRAPGARARTPSRAPSTLAWKSERSVCE